MSELSNNELRLAELLIDVLDLEGMLPGEINPEAPLFGVDAPNSLGLDSIDALEISLAIAKKYKVQLKADDEKNLGIFSSLRSLSNYIHSSV